MEGETQIRSLPGTKSASQVAGEIAARQYGAVSRRQLAAAGIGCSQIRTWVQLGRLHRRQPGVFAWGRPDLGAEGELAVALLHAGPGAALASLTALWWMHLLNRRPRCIHVASPRRVSSRPGIVVSRPGILTRRLHRGLPVVPLPEALLAATGDLSRDSLRLVLARAEFEHLLDRDELEASCAAAAGAPPRSAPPSTRTSPPSPAARTASSATSCCSANATDCPCPSRTSGSAATGPTCSGAGRS